MERKLTSALTFGFLEGIDTLEIAAKVHFVKLLLLRFFSKKLTAELRFYYFFAVKVTFAVNYTKKLTLLFTFSKV